MLDIDEDKVLDIADDYYLNRLTNGQIFQKYHLQLTKSDVSQERIFELLGFYTHKDLKCEYCDSEMRSDFLGKNSNLSTDEIVCQMQGTGLVKSDIREVEQPSMYTNFSSNMGNAFLTDKGYKVSVPRCISCGHQPIAKCSCDYCEEVKKQSKLVAVDQVYEKLSKLKKVEVKTLSTQQIISILIVINKIDHKTCSVQEEELSCDDKIALSALSLADPIKETFPQAVNMTSKYEYYVNWGAVGFRLNSINTCLQLKSELKQRAIEMMEESSGRVDILNTWEELTLEEALGVMEHYCLVYDMTFSPGKDTTAAVKRLLKRFGLAQTCRYILNSVRRAHNKAAEKGYAKYRAFNLIYGNLCFWLDDERARTYNAPPFGRDEKVLAEPESASFFMDFFLEDYEIRYFTDPVSINRFPQLNV